MHHLSLRHEAGYAMMRKGSPRGDHGDEAAEQTRLMDLSVGLVAVEDRAAKATPVPHVIPVPGEVLTSLAHLFSRVAVDMAAHLQGCIGPPSCTVITGPGLLFPCPRVPPARLDHRPVVEDVQNFCRDDLPRWAEPKLCVTSAFRASQRVDTFYESAACSFNRTTKRLRSWLSQSCWTGGGHCRWRKPDHNKPGQSPPPHANQYPPLEVAWCTALNPDAKDPPSDPSAQ